MRPNVRMPSYAAELLHRTERAHRGVIFHGHMPRECSAVYKYGVIAYKAIVSDVCVGHDEVMAADSRDAAALHRATVYSGELAKFVGVPDFQRHTFALIS